LRQTTTRVAAPKSAGGEEQMA